MKNTGEIKIPILNNEYQVIVVFGDNKAVSKCLKKHEFKDCNFEYGTDRAVTIYEEETNPVIALPKKPRTAEEIGTLVHEATHAVFDIFEWIEEEHYDEIFAHSVGAIVREALA